VTGAIDETRPRRIVVVFAGGSADTGVTGVLASLVFRSGDELAGVFLEDHGLFRLAELPFTTELSRVTTTRGPLTTRELERQMKVQALRAERALRSVAEQAGSAWSFRRHRGRLSSALVGLRDADLLLLGAARGALASAGELGATAQLLRRADVEASRPVAVLFDSAEGADHALDAGMRLAETGGRGLTVFLAEDASGSFRDLQQKLRSTALQRATIRTVETSEPGALLGVVRRAVPALLIVGAGEGGFEERRIDALQQELRCPIVVAR
jgi:hypothetical protein